MMNTKKVLLTILLIGILTQTAAAAFTLTWNEPTANTIYNNTPANRKTIDINVTVVDNNAGVRDINIGIIYYDQVQLETSGVSIVAASDWNAFASSNADMNCVGSAWTDPGKDCTYKWTMPLNTVLKPSNYYIDFNVISYSLGGEDYGDYDANATRGITINNSMPNRAVVHGLIQNMIVVIVGMAIAAIAAVGALLKPEPLEFAKVSFFIGMIAVFASLIIGFILPLI